MRRALILAFVALLLIGLGAVWFHTQYEEVSVKRRTEPLAEARRNRYLALERFFARMGRPLELRSDARFLDTLPAGGVLILDSGRRTHLTPERQTHLLAWVEQGGYLIVAPDFPGRDALMEKFDVSRHIKNNPSYDQEEEQEENNEAGKETENAAGETIVKPPEKGCAASCKVKDYRVQVLIPGAKQPLLADSLARSLQSGKIQPAWQAGRSEGGAQYLHFTQGKGHVTVVAGLAAQFGNRSIGKEDHAEIIWTLVQTYQPHRAGAIYLMTQLKIPTLWQWLAKYARHALFSGLALLLLWLWRIVPRFGPLVPEPEPERRQLREHLTAIGRYVWRAGGRQHWLTVGRASFHAQLSLRHPALASLPPTEQAAALAHLTRRPLKLITQALYGSAETVSSFTSAMRTLRNLEHSL